MFVRFTEKYKKNCNQYNKKSETTGGLGNNSNGNGITQQAGDRIAGTGSETKIPDTKTLYDRDVKKAQIVEKLNSIEKLKNAFNALAGQQSAQNKPVTKLEQPENNSGDQSVATENGEEQSILDESSALQDPSCEDMHVVENGYDNANGQDDQDKTVNKLERKEDNLKNQTRKGPSEDRNDDLKKCDEAEKKLAKAYENTKRAADCLESYVNSVPGEDQQQTEESDESSQEK